MLTCGSACFVRCLIELTSRQQQTQRTLLDWLRVEYAIEKPSNKLLAATDLDSDTWVGEVKRIRGKKQPLTAAGVHGLRDEYTRTIAPARALAAETLKLERTLSDLVNQVQVSVLTIDTKPSSASGECATALPKFVRSQTTAFDNALEGADGDWLAAVHGNDGLPPIGMEPFLVAAALAHAREAMRPNPRRAGAGKCASIGIARRC